MARKNVKTADERGVGVVGWVILGALILLTIVGLVWLFIDKNQRNAESDYAKYLPDGAATKTILTKDDISTAQNKAANDGKTKSDWKPKTDIIADVTFGNSDAKVKVIEYESPACSACFGFDKTAQQIMEKYKDDALFTFRFFNPFAGQSASASSQHAEGATAILSAYLMGGEDKFWAMKELIYSPDNNYVCTDANSASDAPAQCRKYIDQYAEKLGLDKTKFEAYMTTNDSAKNGIADKINRDQTLAGLAKVNGTPTWIVNGQLLSNTSTDASSAIANAIKAQK